MNKPGMRVAGAIANLRGGAAAAKVRYVAYLDETALHTAGHGGIVITRPRA